MNEPNQDLERLRDPLSKPTRAARKSLLVASTAGIVIVLADLVPTEIAALGIQFQQADQQTMLTILGAIIAYFLVAFGLYAGTDLTTWRAAATRARADDQWDSARPTLTLETNPLAPWIDQEAKQRAEDAEQDYQRWMGITGPLSVLRVLFEFALPLAVAAYALFLVW